MATSRKGQGAKDRRVTIINYVSSKDTYGGANSTESERFDKWAAVTDKSGSSAYIQSQEQWLYDIRVQVRYDERITSKSMVIYEGETYKIENKNVESDGYKSELILRCSKVETVSNIS